MEYIHEIDEQPLTTLIVGAGAVENAWDPIIKVVREFIPDNVDIAADIANCFFARLIYLMRFNATLNVKENSCEYRDGITRLYNQIKTEISLSLSTSQDNKTIKSRGELNLILSKFISGGNVVTINTNWDTVIDDVINSLYMNNNGEDIVVHHLHGSIKIPNLMYLPSEIVREPYRDKDDDIQLGLSHGAAWRAIENSTKLLLYGISLDPLDAELIQTVAVGISSPKLKKIIIINPDYYKVMQRVKALVDPRFPKSIECYVPSNLDVPIKL